MRPDDNASRGDGEERGPDSSVQRVIAVIVTATILLAAAVGYLHAPDQIGGHRSDTVFYESSAFIPRLALAVVAICALIHVARVVRGASLDAGEDLDDTGVDRRTVIGGMALFAAYALLVPVVGYLVGTFVFATATGCIVAVGWRTSIVCALMLSIVSVLVFVVALKVWFPPAAILKLVS